MNPVPHGPPCSGLAPLLLLILLILLLLAGPAACPAPLTRCVSHPQRLHPFTAGLRRASELLQSCIRELRSADALAGTQVAGPWHRASLGFPQSPSAPCDVSPRVPRA